MVNGICSVFMAIFIWHHRLRAACVLEAFEQEVQTLVLLTEQFTHGWGGRSLQFEQWQSQGANSLQFQ
jgi:dienelactone hydrolase